MTAIFGIKSFASSEFIIHGIWRYENVWRDFDLLREHKNIYCFFMKIRRVVVRCYKNLSFEYKEAQQRYFEMWFRSFNHRYPDMLAYAFTFGEFSHRLQIPIRFEMIIHANHPLIQTIDWLGTRIAHRQSLCSKRCFQKKKVYKEEVYKFFANICSMQ